jgi:hypothetical protein
VTPKRWKHSTDASSETEALAQQLFRDLPAPPELGPSSWRALDERLQQRRRFPMVWMGAAVTAMAAAAVVCVLWLRPHPPSLISVPAAGQLAVTGSDGFEAALSGPAELVVLAADRRNLQLRQGVLEVKSGRRSARVEVRGLEVQLSPAATARIEVRSSRVIIAALTIGVTVRSEDGTVTTLVVGSTWNNGSVDASVVEHAIVCASPAPLVEPPRPPLTKAPVHVEPASTLGDEAALLAVAVRRLGDPKDALAALDQYDKRYPEGELRGEGRRLRVDALLRLERRSEALKVLDSLDAIDEGKRGEELRLLRGDLRLEAGRSDDALSDFGAVLLTHHGEGLAAHALFGRAQVWLKQSKTDLARAALDRYLAQYPNGADAASARTLRASIDD